MVGLGRLELPTSGLGSRCSIHRGYGGRRARLNDPSGASLFSLGMHKSMARCAQGDQIVLGVVSEMAPRVDVVDLEFAGTPATLATPTIPPQDLLAQVFVGPWVKPKSRAFWKEAGHAALQIWARNSCRCVGDRNS